VPPRSLSPLARIVRFTRNIVGVVLLLWLISLGGVLWFGRQDDATAADAIVVFGAAQYAGRPSPVLTARLQQAVNLYRQGFAPRLIVTGGRLRGDITSEARASANWAMRQGVPTRAILIEDESRSTSEQVHAVARIMRERNLSKVIFVSDRFHIFRLRMTAWRLGITARGSPTRTSPISTGDPTGIRYVLAESVKAPLAFLLETREP
jgi:uncharacterized SAM-binding protein YcdF (DUF218 family)